MASLGVSVNAGSSYDYIDIYYDYSAGTNGHTVYAYAVYRKTAGSTAIGYQSAAYLNINGTRVANGSASLQHGSGTYTCIPSDGSWASCWVGHNAAVTITIDYNVYLLNGSYSAVWRSDSFSITLPYVAPPYSVMGAPTMKINTNSAKRGNGLVTVSWSPGSLGGASVSSYVVACGTSSSPTGTWYIGGETTRTFTMPAGVAVGTTYYFRAYQTSTAGPSYNSGWSSTVYVKATTNKPSISIISHSPSSKILPYNSGSGGTASFVISYSNNAGTGSMSISQTSGWSRSGSTISKTVSGSLGSTQTCTVTVSDGYETNSASITYTVNTVPSISAASFTTTNYQGVLPDALTTALVKSFKLSSATVSKSVTGYYLYYRLLDSSHTAGSLVKINSSYEALNIEHTCKSISGLSTNGVWFLLGVLAYDSYDSSSVFWKEQIYFIPKNINEVTSESISWGDYGLIVDDLGVLKVNKNFTVSWTNPVVDDGHSILTSSACFLKVGSGDYNTRFSATNTVAGAEVSSNITSLDSYRGQTVLFKIIVLDEYGNTFESSPSSVYYVIELPVIPNDSTLTASSSEFEPYAGISGFLLTLSTVDTPPTNDYAYEYDYYCPSKNVSIPVGEETDVHEANFEHSVDGEDFATDLLSEDGLSTSENYWNSIYDDGYFRVRLVDAFGNMTDYLSSLPVTIDYLIAPVISSALMKVAYDQALTTYDSNMATIDGTHNRVIANEKAVAYITATDLNGISETQDSLTYRFYYSYGTSSSTLSSWNLISTIVARNTDELQMVFTFPSTTVLMYYKFRVTVTDSTNKQVYYNFPDTLRLVPITPPKINNFLGEYNSTTLEANLTFTMPYSSMPEWAVNRCCPEEYLSIHLVDNVKKIMPELEELYESFNGIDYVYNLTFTGTSVSVPQLTNTYYKVKLTYNVGKRDGSYFTLSTSSEAKLIYVNSPIVSYRDGYLGINRSLKPSERRDLVLWVDTQNEERDLVIVGASESNGFVRLETENNYSILGHFNLDGGTY